MHVNLAIFECCLIIPLTTTQQSHIVCTLGEHKFLLVVYLALSSSSSLRLLTNNQLSVSDAVLNRYTDTPLISHYMNQVTHFQFFPHANQ